MEKSSSSIVEQTVKGIIAFISRTVILDILTVGTSIVIFSIFSAAQVGIYTVVIAIQRVISFFTDFGFGAALVQKKDDLTREDLRTSFTLQSSVTGAIFLAILLLKSPISSLLRLNGDAYGLLLALVFTIFLSSFKVIPSILLERKIHFHKLVIPQLVESVVFNVILLILALRHFGIAAYTWAFLISSIASVPFYYIVSPWEIGLGVHKAALVHLKFGLQFQAKNVLATIKDDFMTVVLRWFLSFSQIGFIGFAQSLAFYPYRYFVDSVTRVTFSTYARFQNDKKMLTASVEKSLFFVSLVMFPLLTGLIIVGPYLIRYFPHWNGKWDAAYMSLVFFSLNAMVSSLSGILINVLDSNGKVKWTLQLMVIWTIMIWVVTPIMILLFSFNGVAIASFLVTLTILYTVSLVHKIIDFKFWTSIYQPIVAAVIMGIITYVLCVVLVKTFVALIIVSLVCGGIYFGIMYVFKGKEVISDVRKLIKK